MHKMFRDISTLVQALMFFEGLGIILRPSFSQTCYTLEEMLRNDTLGLALMLASVFLKLNTLELKGEIRLKDDSKPPKKDA